MSAIHLIATDFDGTLHTDFEQPPVPASLQDLIARHQAEGGCWLVNTGRDLPALMEGMARAHLTIKPDYLGLVEREIYTHDGARYVPLKEWNRACEQEHAALFQRIRKELPRLYDWVSQRFAATIYADAFSPFCVIADDNGSADQIAAYLEDYCRQVPHLTIVRNDVYMRFSHEAFNKGTVMSEVARLRGVAPARIFAAGDHLNDLPMLDACRAHWLVAPANSVEAVKTVVRGQGGHVSQFNWGHGVAEGLHLAMAGRAWV